MLKTKYSCQNLCKQLQHVQDGLVNDSDGIFKENTIENNIDIVWIKFNDPSIRHQQRTKLAQCYTNIIDKQWVPILCISRPIQKITANKKITIRKQFPIQVACA